MPHHNIIVPIRAPSSTIPWNHNHPATTAVEIDNESDALVGGSLEVERNAHLLHVLPREVALCCCYAMFVTTVHVIVFDWTAASVIGFLTLCGLTGLACRNAFLMSLVLCAPLFHLTWSAYVVMTSPRIAHTRPVAYIAVLCMLLEAFLAYSYIDTITLFVIRPIVSTAVRQFYRDAAT